MKTILQATALLVCCLSGLGLASKVRNEPAPPPDKQSLVTNVSVTSPTQGVITISDDDTPFTVDARTTILIDGQPATLKDVHDGMQVLSRTAPDSSSPEIDLKKVEAPPSDKG
jgi:hypothetical protein